MNAEKIFINVVYYIKEQMFMNEYKNIKQLGHCPICGSTEFIVLAKVTGIVPYVHSLSGKKCENDAMYDGLAHL